MYEWESLSFALSPPFKVSRSHVVFLVYETLKVFWISPLGSDL